VLASQYNYDDDIEAAKGAAQAMNYAENDGSKSEGQSTGMG
jgi:hypothetical protein